MDGGQSDLEATHCKSGPAILPDFGSLHVPTLSNAPDHFAPWLESDQH